MSQASPTIGANKSGLIYRQEDNAGKKALLTHHKGPAAPDYAEAGMIWIDDTGTPWMMKFFDGADWISLGSINAAQNTFLPCLGTETMRILPYAEDTGTENAYAVAPSAVIPSYSVGQFVVLKPAHGSTGDSTLAVSGLTPQEIRRSDNTQLRHGDLNTNGVYILVYNGSHFILTNPTNQVTLPAGNVVNRVYTRFSSHASINSIIPIDDTVPTGVEGTEFISASITPQSATNRICVSFCGFAQHDAGSGMVAFLSVNGGPSVCTSYLKHSEVQQTALYHEYVPGTTAPQTLSIRIGANAGGVLRMNGLASTRLFGGTATTCLLIEELSE